MTACSAPGASVNEVLSTLTPGSVARRFGETLPEADCTHGRAATVTASGVVDRLATVIVASPPGWALCSIEAGISDNPPAVSWAALPTAICPSAVPPAPSAARTAPSAMYRFIRLSSLRAGALSASALAS